MDQSQPSGNRPIAYSLLIQSNVWAKLYINDLPLLLGRREGGHTRADLINHLLIPGVNELTIELLHVPETKCVEHFDDAVEVEIYEAAEGLDEEAPTSSPGRHLATLPPACSMTPIVYSKSRAKTNQSKVS